MLPRSAPLAALAYVLQQLTPGGPPVALSIVPPGARHPVLLDQERTVADIQKEFFRDSNLRLNIQYQTRRLADAMATTAK